MADLKILLASASPRRRDLLIQAGLTFTVEPSDADETVLEDLAPEAVAELLGVRKAQAVAARHPGRPFLVVGSDTIVAVEIDGRWELLGKPEDAVHARSMLDALSGSRHQVVTGVAVVDARDGAVNSGFERTWVTMRALTDAEREAYVASGEWQDKAGGYAIQENADAFVTSLEEGGFDNVVGLPVALTLGLLAAAGA
jgi:septum formation protein